MTEEQKNYVRRYLEFRQDRRHCNSIDGEKIECENCGSASELEWHHVIPWSEGGDDSEENLQVLCNECHTRYHSQQNDYRKAGQWGGLVSAYLREQRLGREKFCEEMQALARRRWAA